MLFFFNCTIRSSRKDNWSFVAITLALSILILSGCVGGLAQSFEQSLSVIVPKKIDFTELEYYAIRSKSAYDPIKDIRKKYPLVTRAVTVQSIDVRYFIETDLVNQKQTISIRGTAEKTNVWDDLEYALIPDRILGIPLHRGFQEDAAVIYNDATPHLRKDMPLRITGHSLGGAVAMVLAAYFHEQGYAVERLVTFGQPRITSEPPSGKLVSVATRVVNDLDVVPLVPPHTAIRPYQHFAGEVILREGQDYVYLNVHDADRLSIGNFWRNLTHFSAKDHHIDGYLANIQAKSANRSRQVPYLVKKNSESPMMATVN